MKRQNQKRFNVSEAWKALAPQTVLAIASVSGADGHSIFKPFNPQVK